MEKIISLVTFIFVGFMLGLGTGIVLAYRLFV